MLNSIQLPVDTARQSLHINIFCDGLSALNTVGKDMHLIKIKDKHSDLISITSDLWSTSSFHFTSKHVRAHQDDLNRPLTVEEDLN